MSADIARPDLIQDLPEFFRETFDDHLRITVNYRNSFRDVLNMPELSQSDVDERAMRMGRLVTNVLDLSDYLSNNQPILFNRFLSDTATSLRMHQEEVLLDLCSSEMERNDLSINDFGWLRRFTLNRAPAQIETERPGLTLKKLTEADDEAMFLAIDTDRPHLSQFGDVTNAKYPSIKSVTQAREHPDNPAKLRFGIWDNEDFVGSVGITPYGVSGEVGYWISGPKVGNGYASTALRGLVKKSFADLGFTHLYAKVMVGNEASCRVLEKAGFEEPNGIHIPNKFHRYKSLEA